MRFSPRPARLALLVPIVAALLGGGCNNSGSGGAGGAAAAGTSWSADAAAVSKLDPERTVLGGRYAARTPAGFQPDPQSTDDLIAFKKGKDELMFQAESGIPTRVSAQQYINDNRKMMGAMSDYPGFRPGEIEPGAVGGMPAYRFRFTYDDPDGGSRSGFYYVISREAPRRHMLILAGDAPAESLPLLEAAALSTRPSGGR
jgi:hypothetical protein